jgi:hypothetical protein
MLIAATPEADDWGYSAWTMPPESASVAGATAGNITAGTVYLCGFTYKEESDLGALPATANYLVTSAGSGTAQAGTFVGIYNSSPIQSNTGLVAAGTRLAVSGDVSANNTASGIVPATAALTWAAGITMLPQGFYWFGFLVATNAGTNKQAIGQALNPGVAAGTPNYYRHAVNGTGASTLPATITPASNSLTGAAAFWFALSQA